jgi:hypothetical protein
VGGFEGWRDEAAQLYQQMFLIFEAVLVVCVIIALNFCHDSFSLLQSAVVILDDAVELGSSDPCLFDYLIDVGQDVLLETGDLLNPNIHSEGVVVNLL